MHKSGMVQLNAVMAVSRRGSFRAAAVELGMSSTALSHAVNGLEARLGVRWFNRTTRSVSLPDVGEQFIARGAPALSEIRSAMEGVGNLRDKSAGTLRINSTVSTARRILVSVVLEYLRRYPDMRIDLLTEGRLVDIIAEGFDAGIRTRDVVPGDMIAVPFGADQRFVVVGSPAARGVDDAGAALHAGEPRRIEHADGLRCFGAMDGDEVGSRQCGIKVGDMLVSRGADGFAWNVGIINKNGHVEGGRTPGGPGSDAAEADHEHGLAREFHRHRAIPFGPAAFAHEPVLHGTALGQRHDEIERMFCNADGVRGAGDHQGNAACGERRHLDRVVADSNAGDDLERHRLPVYGTA